MAQVNEQKAATMQQPAPLRLSRVLHARRETAFKAWSSADHVKRWFSPETFTVPEAKVEMHIGGPFDVCMRSPSGEEHWVRGSFVEVVPHTRLVIDMRCIDSAGEIRCFAHIPRSISPMRLAERGWTCCRPTR